MNNLNKPFKLLYKNKNRSTPVFRQLISGFGTVEIRSMNVDQDAPVIHDWVLRDYAKYWGMQGKSLEEVRRAYVDITSAEHSMAFIGMIDGKMAFLCECYDPALDLVGKHYQVQPGDMGMHVLVGPPDQPVRNFTWHVFTTIMEFMFNEPEVSRIVVEPDISNDKIHPLNKRAGFVYQKQIQLPHKTALLAFCTREQYQSTIKKKNSN